MKVHDVTQGDRAWRELRLGMPTASEFDRILTATGKVSSQSLEGGSYYLEKLTEWALGVPLDSGTSGWMRRGTELEEQGRIAYEWEVGGPVTTVGFITRDDGKVGCSPDGLVGSSGILEIKHPSAKQHLAYLLDPDSLEREYRHQTQGNLLIMGEERKWLDLCSFHAGDEPLPMVRVHCEPDAEWREAFEPALESFLARLEAGKARLRALGVER